MQERRSLARKLLSRGNIYFLQQERHAFCESLVCNKRVLKRSDNFSHRISSSRTEEWIWRARTSLTESWWCETGLLNELKRNGWRKQDISAIPNITSSSNITITRHRHEKQLTVKDNIAGINVHMSSPIKLLEIGRNVMQLRNTCVGEGKGSTLELSNLLKNIKSVTINSWNTIITYKRASLIIQQTAWITSDISIIVR